MFLSCLRIGFVLFLISLNFSTLEATVEDCDLIFGIKSSAYSKNLQVNFTITTPSHLEVSKNFVPNAVNKKFQPFLTIEVLEAGLYNLSFRNLSLDQPCFFQGKIYASVKQANGSFVIFDMRKVHILIEPNAVFDVVFDPQHGFAAQKRGVSSWNPFEW